MLQLDAMLPHLPGKRLLVLGDVMVDKYRWGNVDRISPEAPVMVMRTDTTEIRLGGAASVAVLARALEADVALAGVVGDDADGRLCRALLEEHAIDERLVLCDPGRPTISKERFIGRVANRHPHQVLRVDQETSEPIGGELEEKLIRGVIERLDDVEVVVISDYAKGVCTDRMLAEVIREANARKLPVIVDPARLSSYKRYTGATILTPNRAEAVTVLGSPISSPAEVLTAARRLRKELRLQALMITLDKEGIAIDSAAGDSQVFPTRPREVYDVAGAGDMVAAIVGLCQAAGLPLLDTVRLANTAAGLEVERIGVSPITLDEIATELRRARPNSAAKILELADVVALVKTRRARGESIVFTNGCFDLLHVGHVTYLEEAAGMGDVLVVAVNSDASIHQLKGPNRPIVGQAHRAAMLAALSCVDYVVVFDEQTPLKLVEAIRPDILVKGGTYTVDEVVGREVVEGDGGRVCIVACTVPVSTSAIIESVKTRQ
jgi:D-beta-D-heptose 7-phosphate kinase / D-beta-D-heptose 1-phosphate adenosyltransferase